MNEANNNSLHELDDMRSQLNLLKQKLNKEEIVNEKLMRKVTSERLSKIKRDNKITALLTAVFTPVNIYILCEVGMSVPFTIVTTLYMLLCLWMSVYSRRGINPADVINGNLVTTKKNMLRYKSLSNRWLMCAIPFLLIWFSWLIYELSAFATDFNKGAIAGGCIGAVAGTVLGIIYYRKSKKNLDSAIQEITELTKE